MSYELRILSGLHRGAILPLDEELLSIGAHEDADVVLVDPGVEKFHAMLSMGKSGWVVASNGGKIFSADGSPLPEEPVLACGNFFRLGPIWICISEEGDPWPELPAEAAFSAAPASSRAAPSAAPGKERTAPKDSRRKRKSERKSVRRAALMPALVLAITTAAAAYAFTSKSPRQQHDAKGTISPSLYADGNAARQPALDAGTAKPATLGLTPDGLKKAFRKRLTDAELIDRFDLKLEDSAWSMRADLDDEEVERFERVLKTFMDEYRIRFPVNAKIVSAEGMLPFKISQVMSGTNAGIVTDDGHRMYIGDELDGIRLLAVAGNRLKFAGKRKIEVNW